ncbi:MAG TPA: GYD domain-containing protein, partial [Methylomirabilota bacterium]|nr:GYD domain-containing protein [Methylomirabilota bacterium]
KDSPTRLEAAKNSVRQMGGEIKAFYLVMGHYDAVVVSELPDDEAATRFALATAARGYVRTETLRAYPEAEYRKIISALP